LGICAAERGWYTLAVDRFRDGLTRCERLGPTADLQQSNLQLNLALLHKSQGEPKEALTACQKARALYEKRFGRDKLGLATFDAALAGLHASLGQLDRGAVLAGSVLDVCRSMEID